MVKDIHDERIDSSQQKEIERRIKSLVGPYPEDVDKPPTIHETRSGKSTKTGKKDVVTDDLPSTPTVGTVITPDQSGDPHNHEELNNKPPKKGNKIKAFFVSWWQNKKARWAGIAGLAVVIIALFGFPATRYFLFNNVGLRSSATVTVLDDSTQLPLKNVKVTLANASGQTNSEGQVKLEHIKIGKTNLKVSKRAFAVFTQPITVGWGSNPLGNFPIKAVGAQYIFKVTDFLSGKALRTAEASSGDASALSDNQGKIVLTIDPHEISDNMTVTIAAGSYRSEKIALGTDTSAVRTVQMVPARKEAFISNISGHYDLYTSDVDGQNQKLILAGTGLERDDIVLVPHPTDEEVALVSSRVNARNSDGYLLDSLTLVNLKDKTTFNVAQSERIQIVGWIGDKLIYIQIAAGASAASPSRFRLISYDYKTADKKELTKANSFNDVILVGSSIYLAPSSAYQSDPATGLIKFDADGNNKQTLESKEVFNIFRDSYDALDLSVGQDWYQYKIGDSNAILANQAPANPKSRIYITNPDGTHNLWIDQRDGKGVLLDYSQKTASDKILQSQNGLTYPVRWLNSNTFIYRVHNDHETADYVMSIDGGAARKVKDVYNARGIDRWYYY